ncbi:MAG: hypothetical protein AB7T22_12275 [Calditrichaceae bacterium]
MKTLFSILTLIMIFLTACREDDHVADYSLRAVSGPDVIIFGYIDSVQIYEDPVSLEDVSMSGDTLKLEISYSGGCKEHEFLLYVSKDFAESYPVQASVYLSHNSNDDRCKALIRKDLCFNLSLLKEEYWKLYNDNGPIDLNLFAPGTTDAHMPLIRYSF